MKIKLFTLMELLIVIAIIMILASFLIPSLNRAKKSAKEVTCISNLKNISIASRLYLGDNKDKYNGINVHGGRGALINPGFAIVGTRGAHESYNYSSKYKMTNPYLGTEAEVDFMQIAKCPLDNSSFLNFSSTYKALGSSYQGTMRDWNGLANGTQGVSKYAIKTSPSIMLFQWDQGANALALGLTSNYQNFHGENLFQASFIDGHVKKTRFVEGTGVTSTYSFVRDPALPHLTY